MGGWYRWARSGDRAGGFAGRSTTFAAARWAMSSFNAQPWRYIVGVKERDRETWDAVFETLLEGNRGWAQHVPVLALGLVERHFEHNGKPNRHAAHDLGGVLLRWCDQQFGHGAVDVLTETVDLIYAWT